MGGRRRDEHAHRTSARGHRRRAVALAVLVAALTTGIAPGTGGRARAAVGTRPVARAAFTGCDGGLREWTVDGRRVAVRRSPLPPAAYGGHGVDYAPGSCPRPAGR